jgi:hypothetical protein
MAVLIVHQSLEIGNEERPAGNNFRREVGHFTLRLV